MGPELARYAANQMAKGLLAAVAIGLLVGAVIGGFLYWLIA